jgi:hypothetical protein
LQLKVRAYADTYNEKKGANQHSYFAPYGTWLKYWWPIPVRQEPAENPVRSFKEHAQEHYYKPKHKVNDERNNSEQAPDGENNWRLRKDKTVRCPHALELKINFSIIAFPVLHNTSPALCQNLIMLRRLAGNTTFIQLFVQLPSQSCVVNPLANHHQTSATAQR